MVGDNLYYVPDGEERPVPQIVENCEQARQWRPTNTRLRGASAKGDGRSTGPKIHGYMVSVGGRYGVAYIGTAKRENRAAVPFGDVSSSTFINVVYFVQALGWNKVFSYLKHEFFTVRHNLQLRGRPFFKQDLQAC